MAAYASKSQLWLEDGREARQKGRWPLKASIDMAYKPIITFEVLFHRKF